MVRRDLWRYQSKKGKESPLSWNKLGFWRKKYGENINDSINREIIKSFPQEVGNSVANTSVVEHLLQIREEKDRTLIPEKQAVQFHHVVAKLLFVSTRARKDIQNAVAFLATCMKTPDEYVWGKLRRVIKYLNGTRNLKLTLLADNVGIIRWYIDASFVTHKDCKGHTGSMMAMGSGAIICFLRK